MRRHLVPRLHDTGERGDLILNMRENKKHVFGLMGEDVSRSLSPRIHSIAMEKGNIDGVYRTFSVEESELPVFLTNMRGPTISGINVTIPYKEKIIAFLDGLSVESRNIEAVNTIKKDDGKLIGYNTDCQGFLRSLEDRGFDPSGKRVLVLGSGGAARAVCYGLITGGISSLTVASRNNRSASALAEAWVSGFPPVERRVMGLSGDLPGETTEKADIIVNTTPLGSGRFPDASPLPYDCPLHAGQVVVDIVYEPESTPLLRYAEARGAVTMNGVRMLVHQALESLRIWLAVDIDAEYVLNRL